MKVIEKFVKKQGARVDGAPVTLAFLGDSVTQGCFGLYKTGDESFMTEFSVHEGYHNKLRHLFELCYPSVPVNMIHAGINGDSSDTGLERLERDVLSYHPDLTVVSFGLNDCMGGMKFLPTYRASISAILDKLLAAGSEVIFMTPCAMPLELSPEVEDPFVRKHLQRMIDVSRESLPAFMEAAREICAEKGVPLCDCYAKWETLRQNGVNITRLLANRINHPIPEMHWLFAHSLFEMIHGM